jgi:hypothetical protein
MGVRDTEKPARPAPAASRNGPDAEAVKPTAAYWTAASLLVAAGLAFRKGALGTGFIVDDFAHLTMLKGTFPVHRAPLDLFTLVDGSRLDNEALRATGFLPWWSNPTLKVSLFRPLASALVAFDARFLGDAPLAYHLHGAAWWIAMMLVWAAVVRRILPPRWALLALAFSVAHPAHGMLLGWVANRNAMVAMTFGLAGFWAELRTAEGGLRGGRALAVASFALSLCASEYALAFLVYPIFHAIGTTTDRVERRRRIAPLATLLVAYGVIRTLLGFGTHGSGMYLDPTSEPLAFLRAATVRVPVLAGDLVLGVRADWHQTGFPWAAQVAKLVHLPDSFVRDIRPFRHFQVFCGGVAAVVLLFSARASVRATRPGEPLPRFVAFGLPFSLLPVLGGAPEGRLLLPALFGWSIVVSQLLRGRLRAVEPRPLRARLAPVPVLVLLALGAVVPQLYAAGEGATAARFDHAVRASILTPELDPHVAGHRVLLLGAADPTTTIYLPLVRRFSSRLAPASCQLLTSAFARQRLLTISERSFVLERLESEYTAADAYAEAFNGEPAGVGSVFESRGMKVTVERALEGRPLRARYELDVPLRDPTVTLHTQTVFGLEPLPFPPIGGSVILAAPMPPFALMPPG